MVTRVFQTRPVANTCNSRYSGAHTRPVASIIFPSSKNEKPVKALVVSAYFVCIEGMCRVVLLHRCHHWSCLFQKTARLARGGEEIMFLMWWNISTLDTRRLTMLSIKHLDTTIFHLNVTRLIFHCRTTRGEVPTLWLSLIHI